MSAPPLRRRSFLKLGIGSAVVLAVAGGAVSMIKPGLVSGKLSSGAREVMTKVGQAMLAGLLPSEPAALQTASDAILNRTDAFLAGLPAHVNAELDQLFSILISPPGRRLLVGLPVAWADATVAQTSAALQSMRESGTALRIQAYQGLHDMVFLPYFSGEEAWQVIGYPGPRVV